MISFLKRLRLLYVLYNIFQRKRLIHNTALYRKLGMHKRYYSSVSSKDFRQLSPQPDPVLAADPAPESSKAVQGLSAEDQSSLRHFHEEGYAILRNFFSPEQAEQANQEIVSLIQRKNVRFKYGNRIMFAFKHSPFLRSLGEDPRLIEILNALLQTPPVLFQSINFLKGSEQHTHSDSIHMTTYPLGKLAAVWIALEDIGPDNGPLHYYPRSHLLPYYLNADYGNEGNSWLIGSHDYAAYENMIAEKIRESALQKKTFLAGKGDVLIWHANLFHGGEPHRDKTRSRKSMVFHYFGKEAVCYHEITQRPALLDLS